MIAAIAYLIRARRGHAMNKTNAVSSDIDLEKFRSHLHRPLIDIGEVEIHDNRCR